MRERTRLPNRRASENVEFVHNGTRLIGSVSRFDDGRPAEIFLNVTSKVGTDIEAVARDAAVSASLALQYGCPVVELRAAMTKEDEERPAGPVAKLLDLVGEAA